MEISNDTSTGINGMFWMSSMTIAGYIIQIFMTSVLARILTPADYGSMAAINILVGFTDIFWMIGIGPAIVQKKTLTKDDISTGNMLNIILGSIIFLVINFSVGFITNLFSISSSKMLRVFSIVFILHALSGVSKSLTQKKCNFRRMAVIKLIGLLVYGIVAITLAFLNFKVWSLIFANIAQTLAITILYMKLEPVKIRFFLSRNSAKELLFFGGGYTIARVFSYIANNGDNFVINKTLGKISLGSYTKSYQLLMYPVTLIGESLDQVLFPLLSKNIDDSAKLKRVFVSGTGLIMLISVPITLVAFFCAESLVFLVLGDQWGDVILPFRIMVLGLFFRIGYKLSDSLIRAIGKVYRRAYIQFLYAMLVVLGAYIGSFFGLPGVALGVTISFTINYIFMTALSIKCISIKLHSLIKVILPSLAYGGITLLTLQALKDHFLLYINNNFLICFLFTLMCFFVYFILFISTRKKLLSEEFNLFIDQIFINIITKISKFRVRKI